MAVVSLLRWFMVVLSLLGVLLIVVKENCVMYNESGGPISPITGSMRNNSLTEYEICCERSGNVSNLNCSSAASQIVYCNSSGSHLTTRSGGIAGRCGRDGGIGKRWGVYDNSAEKCG